MSILFKLNGIAYYIEKSIQGKYFIDACFPIKRAPGFGDVIDGRTLNSSTAVNKARRAFYRKGHLGKRLDLVRELGHFNSLKSLKAEIAGINKKYK